MFEQKHITYWKDSNQFIKICYNMPKIYTIKIDGKDRQVQIMSAGFTNKNQDYCGGNTMCVNEYDWIYEI